MEFKSERFELDISSFPSMSISNTNSDLLNRVDIAAYELILFSIELVNHIPSSIAVISATTIATILIK